MSITTVMRNVPKVYVSTERATTTLDSGNSPITTYAAYLSSVAMSLQISGGGEQLGTTVSSAGKGSAYCDYADILVTDRVIFNGRKFDVVNILNVNELNIYLKLELVEVDPSTDPSDC